MKLVAVGCNGKGSFYADLERVTFFGKKQTRRAFADVNQSCHWFWE